MNLDIISNTLHFVSGAAIIGFGLVLLFVSNKVRGITRFKIAKNLLALYMLVVGASFYIAYAVGKYEVADKIEALNFISLLIYFIATSLMIGAFIFMFDLKGFLDVKKMIVRVMIPTSLVVLYSLVAILFGDYKVYSLIELYEQIPAHPILLLRLIVFAAVIDFFLYCLRNLLFVRFYNKNILTSICAKNEYINIKTERHFVLGGVMLFVIIMLHYMIPGFFIDLLTSIMLLIINLSLTVVLLNYQDIYQRLSAIVRFVASNDDYSGDEKIVPGRLIRSKLNEWCDRLCVNIGHKELSLNTISNELNVEPAHLYEFIKYEFGENYEQWIVGLRLRCVCNNLDKYQDLEQLADIAGFCNVEIMKKAFYDAKHLSIEQFKLLNWGDYEENNRNNKFCIWVYDPDNRNVRILTGDNQKEELFSLDDYKSRSNDGRSSVIQKIADDVNNGLFESRSYHYTIADLSQPEAKKYIEAICVPLGFIEGRSPLIVGLEYDRTDSRVLVHRLTELISEIDNEKSEAIVSRDNRAAFLANISHDLRSPLNAVIGFSELLQSAESDEEREEYSAIINSSAEALLKLINDLLDLSRFEAGRIKFTKENFDLSQLCKEVHAALKAKITNPDIVFTLSLPCEHLVVYFDRVRMSQILTNFSTNAIKFTKHGKIDMGCEIVGQQVKLYVRDNGCGIPEADQHKVFERFERFNRSEPGTGLGLYICKTIAEEAGGEIGFESVEDHGSIFWVLIPCSPNTLLSDR